MSRSNQTISSNPANRYYSWSGSNGTLNYYDKATEKNVEVSLPFVFIVLDELSTIKGWHDASSSGIYANEVRKTTEDAFHVKAFKGGAIASGIYGDIKEKIVAAGGKFTTNIYIAYKNDNGDLNIGALQFKGAGLQAWSEFKKMNRNGINTKAVVINDIKEGKKGSVKFKTPVFTLTEISDETQEYSIALDKQLQEYLSSYLAAKSAAPDAEAKDEDEFVPTNKIPF